MSAPTTPPRKGPPPVRRPLETSYRPLQWSILKRVARQIGPYKTIMILSLILVVVATGIDFGVALLTVRAIDVNIIEDRDAGGLMMTLGAMCGLVVLGYACQSISAFTLRLTTEKVFVDMRQAVFDKLQTADMAYFDRTPVGWLISRGHRDLQILVHFTVNMFSQVLAAATTFLCVTVILWFVNRQALGVLLLVMPWIWIASYRFRRRGRPAWRRVRKDISRLTASVAEMASGVRVVQAFTREDENLEQFDELNLVNARSYMRTARLHGWYMMTVEGMAFTSAAIVLAITGWKVASGVMGFGLFMLCWRFVGRFFQPIRQMAHMYNHLLQAMAAGERVFGLLDRQPQVGDAADAVDLGRIEGRIKFENVDFQYEKDTPVLKDISFEVAPGQTFALVGATGCGKTTIVSLLNRFYDVTGGRILVDGQDIRTVTAASLHSQTGLILQENFLFDGTVMDNIKHARPDTSDEDVETMCRTLGCHSIFERLVQGYRTQVGERGNNLSAGQRQLVSIARAMVASPRILMLDEATSSVDTRTELAIQYALERLIERRTSFVVAHRLSTVRRADQILVMDQGRIIERGAHAELVELGGKYAALHEEFMRVEDE